MRAGFIVTGVLGIGTVLVFGAAALVSLAFPNGATVAAGWNGGGVVWAKGGAVAPMAVPVTIDASGGTVVAPDAVPSGQ
jgi:hypothetical protein